MNGRRVGLVVGWIIATSLAIMLASQAVALVRDQVTDRPSKVATTLALETTTSTSVTTATTATATSTPQPITASTSTTLAETTTSTLPETTTTSVPTTSSTTTTATINQEQTFYLVGGWATVRCAGDDVTLATYAPNPGYQVEIESAGPTELEIKFEEAGGDHRSKLDARCTTGMLDPQIDERDED
jgi:hypothetical protein